MTRTQKNVLIASAAVLALAGTAIGASYVTRQSVAPTQQAKVVHHSPTQQVAAAKPPCDDHNIVGTVGGAVAGGVIGNQFGKGTGKTIATVGGAAGGAVLGNEYIPTRGATCQ